MILLILGYLIIHIMSIPKNLRKVEVYLLLIAGIIGTFVDSLLLNFNLLSYEAMYDSINYIAPLWITGMWVGFTATLNHAFKNIIEKYFTQTILGIIAGPIAYATGNSLGAIKFNTLYSDNFILLIIALVWGISFPLLCLISNKIRS